MISSPQGGIPLRLTDTLACGTETYQCVFLISLKVNFRVVLILNAKKKSKNLTAVIQKSVWMHAKQAYGSLTQIDSDNFGALQQLLRIYSIIHHQSSKYYSIVKKRRRIMSKEHFTFWHPRVFLRKKAAQQTMRKPAIFKMNEGSESKQKKTRDKERGPIMPVQHTEAKNYWIMRNDEERSNTRLDVIIRNVFTVTQMHLVFHKYKHARHGNTRLAITNLNEIVTVFRYAFSSSCVCFKYTASFSQRLKEQKVRCGERVSCWTSHE